MGQPSQLPLQGADAWGLGLIGWCLGLGGCRQAPCPLARGSAGAQHCSGCAVSAAQLDCRLRDMEAGIMRQEAYDCLCSGHALAGRPWELAQTSYISVLLSQDSLHTGARVQLQQGRPGHCQLFTCCALCPDAGTQGCCCMRHRSRISSCRADLPSCQALLPQEPQRKLLMAARSPSLLQLHATDLACQPAWPRQLRPAGRMLLQLQGCTQIRGSMAVWPHQRPSHKNSGLSGPLAPCRGCAGVRRSQAALGCCSCVPAGGSAQRAGSTFSLLHADPQLPASPVSPEMSLGMAAPPQQLGSWRSHQQIAPLLLHLLTAPGPEPVKLHPAGGHGVPGVGVWGSSGGCSWSGRGMAGLWPAAGAPTEAVEKKALLHGDLQYRKLPKKRTLGGSGYGLWICVCQDLVRVAQSLQAVWAFNSFTCRTRRQPSWPGQR